MTGTNPTSPRFDHPLGEQQDPLTFPSEQKAVRFVENLVADRSFCEWCLSPLQRQDEELLFTLSSTYDAVSDPTADVPPDRTNGRGKVLEVSRSTLTICECGRVDVSPSESRDRETVDAALGVLVSLLKENGVDIDAEIASDVVAKAFAEGRTGQFETTLGRAIYEATK